MAHSRSTNDKKEYRRAQAVLEKSEGKTHKAIAKEHGVDERTTQRWIAPYIKKEIEGLQICRNSRSKSSITDEDKDHDKDQEGFKDFRRR